ncbi:hypothetical protein RJT34_12837 [Clitoria ternatea]|uniref:GYF domain-containing protein n=1 Tax=Clitoria ternatea TaxID=43366 RepID=A0AAN9JMJ9_CLITE
MNQKLKLEIPSEQSRLLGDIPMVIPEMVDTNLSPEGSPRRDKLQPNGVSELAIGETCDSVGHHSGNNGFAHCLNNRTDVAVETIVQDVENDKGVPTLDSSQIGGEMPESNKELRVYTRRNLQQKTVQPIISTLEQVDSLEISLENAQGQKTPAKKNQDCTAFSASVEQLVVLTASQDKGTSQRKLPHSTSGAGKDGPKVTFFTELHSDSQNSYPAKHSLRQPRSTKCGSGIDGINLCATSNAKQATEERQNISYPFKVSVNGKQDTSIKVISVEDQEFASPTDVIVLSDNEEEENIADNSKGRKLVENPEISVWHCVGPYGLKGGPYSMSALKQWNKSAPNPLEFKVWKTGQSETEAIPLTDALNRVFSRVKGLLEKPMQKLMTLIKQKGKAPLILSERAIQLCLNVQPL